MRPIHVMPFAALLGACVAQTPPASEPGRPVSAVQPVYCVERVETTVQESMPPTLSVSAEGLTRTAGWSEPSLVPLGAPSGGTLRLVLQAQAPAPDTLVAQMLSPVSATWQGQFAPAEMPQTVEVVAEQGGVAVPVGGASAAGNC